jgi:hypothetical protein
LPHREISIREQCDKFVRPNYEAGVRRFLFHSIFSWRESQMLTWYDEGGVQHKGPNVFDVCWHAADDGFDLSLAPLEEFPEARFQVYYGRPLGTVYPADNPWPFNPLHRLRSFQRDALADALDHPQVTHVYIDSSSRRIDRTILDTFDTIREAGKTPGLEATCDPETFEAAGAADVMGLPRHWRMRPWAVTPEIVREAGQEPVGLISGSNALEVANPQPVDHYNTAASLAIDGITPAVGAGQLRLMNPAQVRTLLTLTSGDGWWERFT